MASGIYRIVNLNNSKQYIGSTNNFSKRWYTHKLTLKANKHRNKHLQASWNKYGESAFKFEILWYCTKEELIKTEQFFLDKYKEDYGWDNLYNIYPKAYSPLGFIVSKETKKKTIRAKERTENLSIY